ncbi:MAG: hypothetical protein HY231_19715 [Acidobacteria bacterium]|nr:hypothetical protein [Acidobacteriota bacterium]
MEGKIYRSDVCPKCEADVHCCVNCDQYEPTAHNKCLEPQAEWVTDREKANYCDFFVARKETRNLIVKQRDSARLDFDNLFKKQ